VKHIHTLGVKKIEMFLNVQAFDAYNGHFTLSSQNGSRNICSLVTSSVAGPLLWRRAELLIMQVSVCTRHSLRC
jgi:hypothetical protein